MLAGGHLRYLYKKSRLLTYQELEERPKIEKIMIKDNNNQIIIVRLLAFYQSLKDIVLFFLAPLLALDLVYFGPMEDNRERCL
jgi:hypothetical protein